MKFGVEYFFENMSIFFCKKEITIMNFDFIHEYVFINSGKKDKK
ncbi:hypothetical protein PEDI_17540 [Persicobacter diffluens]|uniref:Uncharacterized protein n=1 Tax=Persicobacter diffluens TaxID=981 RepID=A0AAN4VYP3_9BACT|nr:hypothetical protein PEDI_17540 [Persicobacter diffluens]